ncbi:hypothetical protein GH5_01144 [Leishmania sp. Ghana 2012 LV757]|uniref:hypothetical protein n=1 Tax=Leishmania sp. Ghana 2012 LV757 TaxID=2803181 RepID=UPI001B704150|nr:hypothetical protein GH5_01144 [Leishmania sp. Ghana 2012 LV757]
MSYYIKARREDERFTARLEEVNKELDGLLLKTSRARHELDRTATEVRMGVPLHVYPRDVSCRVDLSPSTSAGDPLGQPQVRDGLAHNAAPVELSPWARSHLSSLVAPLVEAQMQQQLRILRDSIEELRARQGKVEKAAMDATEQAGVHHEDMCAAFAAAQEATKRDMKEHRQDVKRLISACDEELQRLREDVLAMKRQSVSNGDRQEQQMSEALRRQQAHVQGMLETLEHELRRWRQMMSRSVQKEMQELQAQHRTLENRVAQAEVMLRNTADMAAHCTEEVRRLMEEAVVRSSEVRVCRRDVNRLEILVQCSSMQTAMLTGEAGSSNAVDNNTSPHAVPVVNRLIQDVARLSDCLHAVMGRVDCLDRHVRQLEMAVARGTSVSCGQSTHHGSMRGVDEESSYGRSFASTCRPSYSHLSNATGLRGHRASAGFAGAPSPSVCNDSVDATPIRSGAAENKVSTTSIAFVSAAQQVGVGGAPDGGHPGTACSTVQMPRTHLMPTSPPSTIYRLPTPHLGSSMRFEDDADDSPPIPVMIGGASSAPSVEDDGVILCSGAAGADPQRPPQHCVPPRVVPVQTAESDTQSGSVADPTATKSAARAIPLPDDVVNPSPMVRKGAAYSLADQRDASSCSASSMLSAGGVDAAYLAKSPSLLLEEREAAAVAEEGALKKQSVVYHKERPAVATPGSPADSYVSDTPAAHPNASKVSAASVLRRDLREAAQYTPAQASDSESERDNQVIARSALD